MKTTPTILSKRSSHVTPHHSNFEFPSSLHKWRSLITDSVNNTTSADSIFSRETLLHLWRKSDGRIIHSSESPKNARRGAVLLLCFPHLINNNNNLIQDKTENKNESREIGNHDDDHDDDRDDDEDKEMVIDDM
eukprot:gb/GECH01001527.1/.p1 GENE.gb/GECH01001527.1/~~gb/GECH01001527.1/.p1  ORF type:complete len:134 (+),score=36.50 gb/GECH01001527.1/:1-402(+)